MKTDELTGKLNKYIERREILNNLAKSTIKNYNTSNKLFISYLISNNINDINNDNINNILENYMIYLKKEKTNSYSSINKYLQHIILFLNTLELAINIQLPKDNSKNKKIKYLKPEEIQEVINSIPKDNIRDRTIIQTLYRTGLRVSELANLTKQNIDLNATEKTIVIDVKDGKGGKDRTVYIDHDTLKLINNMIYKRTRKGKEDKNDYLFIARTGNQLQTRDIERIVKKYAIATDKRLAKDGIKSNHENKLTPHTLRHSYTIYLLNVAKRPINEVQELLGHTNITTTQIYSKVDNETIKKGYDKIEWD